MFKIMPWEIILNHHLIFNNNKIILINFHNLINNQLKVKINTIFIKIKIDPQINSPLKVETPS